MFAAVKSDATQVDPLFSGDDIIEFQLLFPSKQAAGLEHAASQRGMTIGQLIRRTLAQAIPFEDTDIYQEDEETDLE